MPRVLKILRLLCALTFASLTAAALADAIPAKVAAWGLSASGVGYLGATLAAWRLRLKA